MLGQTVRSGHRDLPSHLQRNPFLRGLTGISGLAPLPGSTTASVSHRSHGVDGGITVPVLSATWRVTSWIWDTGLCNPMMARRSHRKRSRPSKMAQLSFLRRSIRSSRGTLDQVSMLRKTVSSFIGMTAMSTQNSIEKIGSWPKTETNTTTPARKSSKA